MMLKYAAWIVTDVVPVERLHEQLERPGPVEARAHGVQRLLVDALHAHVDVEQPERCARSMEFGSRQKWAEKRADQRIVRGMSSSISFMARAGR